MQIKKNKYEIILGILIIFLVLSYVFSFFFYNLPYRQYGDVPNHIATIKQLQNQILKGDVISNVFPDLYRNSPHNGVYFILVLLVSIIFGLSIMKSFFIFGIINIILLYIGLYSFIFNYLKDKKIAITSVLLFILLSGIDLKIHGSSFAFIDLMVSAHYPVIFSSALMLIALSLNISYLFNPSKKYFLISLILAFMLFNSHLLIGFIYFGLLFLLLITEYLKNQGNKIRILKLSSIIPLTLIIALFWPFYSYFLQFVKSNPIQVKPIFSIEEEFFKLRDIILPSILGIVFLIRKKYSFLLIWSIVFLIISFSFLFPVRIPLYWRFAFLLKIPLIIGLGIGLVEWQKLNLGYKRFFFMLVVFFLIISSLTLQNKKMDLLLEKDNNLNKYFFVTETIPEGSVVFSDKWTSYFLPVMGDYYVLIVPWEHVENIDVRDSIMEREKEIEIIFKENKKEKWKNFIDEYNIDYFLLVKNRLYKNINFPYKVEKFDSKGGYEIIKIIKDES